MKNLVKKPNLANIIIFFFTAILLVACNNCDGPSDVMNVSKIKAQDLPPEVTPGPEPGFKIIIKIDFNIDVDPTTFSAPGNINISAKGNSGHTDNMIQGTVQYVASTKSAYFIILGFILFTYAKIHTLYQWIE